MILSSSVSLSLYIYISVLSSSFSTCAYCDRSTVLDLVPSWLPSFFFLLLSLSLSLQSSGHRVKFAPEPLLHSAHANNNIYQPNNNSNNNNSSAHTITSPSGDSNNQPNLAPLQRSKSLSSADTLARGLASLGLGIGSEGNDIGMFAPEVQAAINSAIDDPNQLNARCLMDLATQLLHRAVEGRR